MKRALTGIFVAVTFLVTSHCFGQTTITKTTVNQWIRPEISGVLEGRIIVPTPDGFTKTVQGARVAIQGFNGSVARSDTPTNARGEFKISGVKPGVYALLAQSDEVFAVCAMHVLESNVEGGHEFPGKAEISAANIDFATVKTTIVRYLPPNVNSVRYSFSGLQLGALTERVCADETFRVAQVLGGMQGRLHAAGAKDGELQFARMTNVFIIQNGIEVARAVTNERGGFVIPNLDAGSYSLLAAGPDGLGLMSFELIDEDAMRQRIAGNDSRQQFAFQSEGDNHKRLVMQLAPVPEIVDMVDARTEVDQLADNAGIGVRIDPTAGSGIVGDPVTGTPVAADSVIGTPITGLEASGGTIGNGIFGNRLGGIVLATGGAGIITLIAADDDDTTISAAPPASPVVP